MKNGNWFTTGLSVLVIGGLIGAGIALMVAPYSGRTTRALLYSRGVALRDKANEEAIVAQSRLKNEWNGLTSSVRLNATELGDRVQQAVDHPQATLNKAVSAVTHAH